jgi:predicted transcriptional regulator
MDDENWELYSWVIRGNQRRKVIMALGKPKIPTEIKREAKMSMTNVSKVLKEFMIKGLVMCLTPDEKTGKIYKLTETGRKIREKMIEK